MALVGRQEKQGLYDPNYEHDACGVGFIVNIKGEKSHGIIQQALEMISNLHHRGACGCETNTGDGAGVLLQIPHNFLSKVVHKAGFKLPASGDYGVGMLFLPTDDKERNECEQIIESVIAAEGQTLLGWRVVPTDHETLGASAKRLEPVVRQVFIERSDPGGDPLAFERKLYVIRKQVALRIYKSDMVQKYFFYAASMSARTIVYKGMLLTGQLELYYPDLSDEDMISALALVHSRFSTNTFPSWDLAHPYRYIIHNGEINTIRGNENWNHAREALFESEGFGEDVKKVRPIINATGSDSAKFDNCLEFLVLAGWDLPKAVMMMIPEPWSKHATMSESKKAFYEYHGCLMEPWDGPASVAFTDGERVGAVLDRNGLRPSRYYVTKSGCVIMASEVGVIDVPPEEVEYKGRLQPGRMFLIDTCEGRVVSDEELKQRYSNEAPYRAWLDEHVIQIDEIPNAAEIPPAEPELLTARQTACGYTFEELRMLVQPMAMTGIEARGYMGNDTPPAVLSDRPQLLFNYFRELFAQVTNPPLDAIREELVTATDMMLGPEGNQLEPKSSACRKIHIPYPVLTNERMAKLRGAESVGFHTQTLSILFPVEWGEKGLATAMTNLCREADRVIEEGAELLILSDRGIDSENVAIPSLLAVAGLHHHLIRNGLRMKIALIVESAEPKEVHHYAALLGYGASAINPYLAYETLDEMIETGMLEDITYAEAEANYVKAAVKGVVKVLSKVGISAIQSYHGAQIFEAMGLRADFVDEYFTWTATRIEGIGIEGVARELLARHTKGFAERGRNGAALDAGGDYQWRNGGERHLFNPRTIHKLQVACERNDYDTFKEFSALIDDQMRDMYTLRGLLEFKFNSDPVPIDEVESVDDICKRFKTGAMSYGSISREAHETLAIAMNRIGGKSNTGEGGEDSDRFTPDENGDWRRSAIKQVASGRFGVSSEYLVNCDEIQIKMAQGAKPGEGGELPGRKVYPWIAKVRGSTPGVGLISPPPHHDIYSIEDLAELIHDLKNANRAARINVKLVSEVGVGTIAAGVAKGHADVILISGADGGTGASPQTSIRHAGLPWELGLAETHQTLILNNLRSRVRLETDGQLKTGRDVAIACLLGAEEFGFSTAPLVTMGCIMMRVCHLDTCPVGVATQNEALRKKFRGDPSYVVNFMRFIAQELREWMAKLGFRKIDEMVGHVERLESRKAIEHWKAKGLDYSKMLHAPDVAANVGRFGQIAQKHGLRDSLDMKTLLDICKPAIERGEKVKASLGIKNTNRVVGTITGSDVTRKWGAAGLPDDTIEIRFKGSAGQSFAAFMPRGMTFLLEGDGNDYFCKGLSGGKVAVYPPAESTFEADENIVIGNVALYGATAGEAYVCGLAGERFCVRNSGATAVVEGVGDHGCEYMTDGRVVVLGATGRNFGAGMSGGIAYVFDEEGDFESRFNAEMAGLAEFGTDDADYVKRIIQKHVGYTRSKRGQRILDQWDDCISKFVKVLPRDYARAISAMSKAKAQGMTGDESMMAAFQENSQDVSRVSGN